MFLSHEPCQRSWQEHWLSIAPGPRFVPQESEKIFYCMVGEAGAMAGDWATIIGMPACCRLHYSPRERRHNCLLAVLPLVTPSFLYWVEVAVHNNAATSNLKKNNFAPRKGRSSAGCCIGTCVRQQSYGNHPAFGKL
jgi:hypothetical protein